MAASPDKLPRGANLKQHVPPDSRSAKDTVGDRRGNKSLDVAGGVKRGKV